MVFFNFDRKLEICRGYEIIFDHDRQEIRITPSLQNGDVKIAILAHQFVFNPTAILENHNLAPYWLTHSCWGLESRNGDFSLGALHPVYPQTLAHKGPFLSHHPIYPRPILIYVPLPQSRIEDMAVLCYVHPEATVDTNSVKNLSHGRSEIEQQVLPRLKIEMPTRCPSTEVCRGLVRMTDSRGNQLEVDEDVYLESSAGYLSHSRLSLKKGLGHFCFKPELLQPEETVHIKAGFKFFSGKATHRLTVV